MLGMGKINPVMQWLVRPWTPGFAEIAATDTFGHGTQAPIAGHTLILQSQQEIHAVR